MRLPIAPATPSFFDRYTLPGPTFAVLPEAPVLHPLWQALAQADDQTALVEARRALEHLHALSAPLQAALLTGAAEAERRAGSRTVAERLAEASLRTLPTQWSAHLILLKLLEARQDYDAAYLYFSGLSIDGPGPAWDESFSSQALHLTQAALAWRVGDWEGTHQALGQLYPDGLKGVPAHLLQDWFRLALYREQPDLAATAAACLLPSMAAPDADALLQILVQQGWTDEALPLYRDAFRSRPNDPVLRRRLVGLCLRVGAVEEARRLTSTKPLRIS